MNTVLKGIRGLLISKKGTLSLIIFTGSLIGLFVGKLDGMPFAGIVSTIALIYNYTAHKMDLASMNAASFNSTDPTNGLVIPSADPSKVVVMSNNSSNFKQF